AIVAGAFAVVAATVTLVIGKIWEQKIKLKQEVYAKKVPVYETQVSTLFEIVFAGKKGEELDQDKVVQMFADFTEKLMIWGGPEVIRCWQQFRLHDWQDQP